MVNKMVWSNTEKKFVSAKEAKEATAKVALSASQYATLKGFAQEDGFDFKGISYEMEKDKDGKTKHNKDGNAIFKLDKEGKKIAHPVEVSTGKVNSAVAEYVRIAVDLLIASRKTKLT